MLIVDDNQTNRLILREMIESWEMRRPRFRMPMRPCWNCNGPSNPVEPYRVVLTDVHMPDIDGFQLTERIKSSSDLGGTVILMLTSGDGPGDIDALPQGRRRRPFDQAGEAVRAVRCDRRVARPRFTTPGLATSEISAPTSPTQPLRILLAEDSFTNQRLAVGLLSKWGHDVTVAKNGLEAIAAFDADSFDLVLMDVQMPEMDGFQATAVIREREACRSTRISDHCHDRARDERRPGGVPRGGNGWLCCQANPQRRAATGDRESGRRQTSVTRGEAPGRGVRGILRSPPLWQSRRGGCACRL